MKIAVAQINYHIGNFDSNLDKMLQAVANAKDQNADIVCFSELSTCGYPPRDFLEFDDFINLSNRVVDELAKVSSDIGILLGAPTNNPKVEGKDLFNSAIFLYEGKVNYQYNKALLPTYDVFDEYRYFEPGKQFDVLHFKGKKIAITVCEDIWELPIGEAGSGFENPLYNVCPMQEMWQHEPDFAINISASPFSFTHAESRIKVLRQNTKHFPIPIFYVNHVGAQTELIFDGGSIIMSPNGMIYDELPYFEESFRVYDLDSVIAGDQNNEQEKSKLGEIHDALVLGIKDYFGKLGFSKAIIGLSGGIDSAVTTYLAAKALGSDNVRVLLMPSQFSSDHSVQDAKDLAETLGIQYDIVAIKDVFDSYMERLTPIFGDTPFNVTEENIQARIRGVLLMAVSNKKGNIVLNTSNKSEAAVGYGTLYGDMCGGLSVIGDVYKTEVFALAKYINRDGEIIPENTITKPPSAELRPNQKDSDSLPEYDILDEILFQYIEQRKGPKEIIAMGFDEALVKRICRLVNINEFKRFQTAPTLRVSNKAFGMGRRMPIVGKYLS